MAQICFHTFYEQFEILQDENMLNKEEVLNLVEKIFILLSSKFGISEFPFVEFFHPSVSFGWKTNYMISLEIYNDLIVTFYDHDQTRHLEYDFSENDDLLDELCQKIKNNLN